MPAELDEAQRRVMQLKLSGEALKKETDAGMQGTAGTLEKELAELKRQADALRARVAERRRTPCRQLRDLRERIEQTKVEIEQAERQYDLDRAAELRYGQQAELERSSEAEAAKVDDRRQAPLRRR